jgi:ferredoxin
VDSPFEVLLIEPGADDEAVEQAYRERVKEAHPDQGGSAEEFQLVRIAYEEIKSARESGDGFDPASADGEGDGGSATRNRPLGSLVEYLNYEVLTDHSWWIDDDDLFEKAADAGLDPVNFGRFRVEPGESLLEAAERHEFAWPYACRGGACANCATVVLEGELSMPVNTVLPGEMVNRGIRLSCNGIPVTDELKVVYNVKHMPDLEDLLLPPRPWKQAHLD